MKSAARTTTKPKRVPVEEPPSVVRGSRNLFRDVGLPDPDLLLAKADLHTAIYLHAKHLKLTKAKLAKLLGVNPPDAAALLRVEGEFTFDRLFRFLNALGHEVVIAVRPAADATPAETRVEAAESA